MFGFFNDFLMAGLNALDDLSEGELPSKSDLVTMMDAGLTIAAISEATGIAQDVLEGIAND